MVLMKLLEGGLTMISRSEFVAWLESINDVYIEDGEWLDEKYNEIFSRAKSIAKSIDKKDDIEKTSSMLAIMKIGCLIMSPDKPVFGIYGFDNQGRPLTIAGNPYTEEMKAKWKERHKDEDIEDPYEHTNSVYIPTKDDNKNNRPSKTQYYLNIAKAVSERSTCLRRHYGAVIVKDDRIISTGYNGSAVGCDNCSDVGYCKREALKIPHGERYEMCVAVHAEQNAIIQASADEMLGSTIYVYGYDCIKKEVCSGKACMMCERVIKNAGMVRCVISDPNKEDGYSSILTGEV